MKTKFTLYIKEGNLWGKEVNPYGEKPILIYSEYGIDPEGATDSQLNTAQDEFEMELDKWEAAESQLKSYPVSEESREKLFNNYIKTDFRQSYFLDWISGQTIEATLINGEIVI